MGALLVFLATVSAFLGWPINRWASRSGGSIQAYGFAANTAVAILSVALILLTGGTRPDLQTLALGATAGVAIVAGYWTVVMAALREGPAGPTVAIYNLALVWPVVVGTQFIAHRPLGAAAVAGVALAVAALAISVTGPPAQTQDEQRPASQRWLVLAVSGWLLGGVTMALLITAQMRSPGATLHICLSYSLVAALLMAPMALGRRRAPLRSRQYVGGMVAGSMLFVNSVTVLGALRWLGPAVVYTLPTVIPILLMLAVGHARYGERLTVRGWATCLVGACAVLALVLGGG